MSDAEYAGDAVAFGVCICTRNRPAELSNALESMRRSSIPVSEVIVSDDSTDDRSRVLVEAEFPEVRFIEGPRRGLSANRNCAIDASRSPYLLFLDDDAALGESFFASVAIAQRASRVAASRLIVSGLENQYGRLVEPSGPTFLGYQMVAYRSNANLRSVVINATVFPRAVFETLRFDENLVYGCEELDISTRAAAAGYTIVLERKAINYHFPSPVHRSEYASYVNASRMYVAFKRYAFVERRYLAAALFAVVAPLHLLASLTKQGNLASAFRLGSISLRRTLLYLWRYRRDRTDAPRAVAAKLP